MINRHGIEKVLEYNRREINRLKKLSATRNIWERAFINPQIKKLEDKTEFLKQLYKQR